MNWASKCNHFEEVESLIVGITTGGRRLSFPTVGEKPFCLAYEDVILIFTDAQRCHG